MRDACSVDGCGTESWARGYCHKHLSKVYRYGDPLAGRARTDRGYGKGGKSGGYIVKTDDAGIRRPAHVLIAEAALGKRLPTGAIVHHVDRCKENNAPSNLVICPSQGYHLLIHQRMRARDACGNPNWRICCRCSTYDDPANLSFTGSQAYHAACNRKHVAKFTKAKR